MLFEASFLYLKKVLNKIIDFIFPTQCILCDKNTTNYICDRCNYLISKHQSNSFLSVFEDNNSNRSYDKLFYIFRYEKIIRKIMINYKFYAKPYICNFFVSRIINNQQLIQILKEYDCIVPVPMSRKKECMRGYNQTSLVTTILSRKLNIQHSTYLKKSNKASTQSKLNKNDRKSNIEGAFYITNKNAFQNKKVILLDDIYTTGNTIEECARLIKNDGAKKIFVIILARDFMK